MTDQPKPTPGKPKSYRLSHVFRTREDGQIDLFEDGKFIATFVDIDREANARKFMHMDELVKWADEFIALEDSALKEWAKESFIPWTGNEPCMVRLQALKTILAKIDGGK